MFQRRRWLQGAGHPTDRCFCTLFSLHSHTLGWMLRIALHALDISLCGAVIANRLLRQYNFAKRHHAAAKHNGVATTQLLSKHSML